MRKNPLERHVALRRNIAATIALRILMGSMAFIIPTIVLLWQQNGMGMQKIMLLQAIFALSLAVFEVPTGYLADAFGRKSSLVAAAFTLVAGAATYFIADSFSLFVLAEVLLALGFSFVSGADQALLYDSLKELGRETEFGVLWGRASFWTFVLGAASAIAGGYAGAFNLRLPLLLELIATLMMLAVTLYITEPKRFETGPRRASLGDLSGVFKESMRPDSGLRWLILYPALLFGLNQVAVWMYAPYFTLSGVEVEYFGLIFALFNVTAALASRYASHVDSICGELMSMVLPLALLVTSYLLLGNFVYLLSFSFALLQQIVRGYTTVAYSQQLNTRISSERRATMLSLQSMAGRLTYAVALLPVGYLADHAGLLATMQVTGVTTLLLGGVALAARYGRA